MVGGLYQTTDYAAKAMGAQQGVAQTTASMQRAQPEEEKTVGGAMGAAAGGALAGSAIMPGWGTAVGAVAGLAMYYM